MCFTGQWGQLQTPFSGVGTAVKCVFRAVGAREKGVSTCWHCPEMCFEGSGGSSKRGLRCPHCPVMCFDRMCQQVKRGFQVLAPCPEMCFEGSAGT